MHRTTRALLCALAACVALPATAPAALPTDQDRHMEFVAYGEGVTRCGVQVERTQGVVRPLEYGSWRFSGSTSCTAAVQQTGDAWMSSNIGVFDPPACTGVRASCTSAAGGFGLGPQSGTVKYRVELVAPRGQGWGVAPAECAGTGTDRVSCEFVVDVTAYV